MGRGGLNGLSNLIGRQTAEQRRMSHRLGKSGTPVCQELKALDLACQSLIPSGLHTQQLESRKPAVNCR